jgi:hypothetical protein
MRGKERRLHLSIQGNLSRNKFQGKRQQQIERKPLGMWYGFNDSWISWCLSEEPCWLTPYIYEVVLNEDRILKISGEKEFDEFEAAYGQRDEFFDKFVPSFDVGFRDKIDYTRLVAEGHHGIEINPYLWSRRLKRMWYYGWDCASGCVWNKRSVLDVRLFAEYDAENNEFVKCTNKRDVSLQH